MKCGCTKEKKVQKKEEDRCPPNFMHIFFFGNSCAFVFLLLNLMEEKLSNE